VQNRGEELPEEAEMPNGSMANLDSSNMEQKAFHSVHRCLLVLTAPERRVHC